MGFLGKVDEFFREEGETLGEMLPEFLHKASNFACQLYKNKPGIIYDLNEFNKGLWEKLCAPRPPGLPDAPSPNFQGGQCPFYYVIVYSLYDGTVQDRTDQPILGAISGIDLGWVQHPRTQTWGWKFLISAQTVYNAERYDSRFMINASATFNESYVRPGLKPTFLRIYPRDGQVDSCGSLPPPKVPPYIAPEADRMVNITYTYKDGTDVTIPVVLSFPTVNNTFKLQPSLTLQVKTNPEINFHLYPDGWYSEPGHPAEPPKSDPKIDYFINPPNPDADPLLKPSDPIPPASFAGDEDVPSARWLRVILTKMPDKAQYGVNTPTVWFAGWMEFTKGGACFPRQQINFEESLFRFPDGADGYYVQFTNGAEGSVVVYTQLLEE